MIVIGLTQSKLISTDPKIINKQFDMFGLQVNSMQTSVKAGRARSAILKALAKFLFPAIWMRFLITHMYYALLGKFWWLKHICMQLNELNWPNCLNSDSDVNEENVIQTFCTDNILRPKKSLKWPVSQFHLAHYSSTNVCLKN